MLNTFLTNRAGDLYPAPDTFRPERWSTIAPSAFEFPVFSAGPHTCPGYWFGLTTVKIALAAIVTRYRVELPADARVDYRVQPTLRPRAGLHAVLRREDGSRRTAQPITGGIRNLIKFPA
jgi:cytochrome P450